MKNKKIIIGGVIAIGIVAYYFYNKNKVSVNTNSKTSEKLDVVNIPNTVNTVQKNESESGFLPCKGQDGVVRNMYSLPIGTKCY